MDVLTKQLPSMQMDVLKAELKKASEYSQLKNEIENKDKLLKEYANTIIEIKNELNLHSDLQKKREDLEMRERNLKVALLETKLSTQDGYNASLKELVYAVFRNPHRTTYINGQGDGSQNSYGNLNRTITENID